MEHPLKEGDRMELPEEQSILSLGFFWETKPAPEHAASTRQ